MQSCSQISLVVGLASAEVTEPRATETAQPSPPMEPVAQVSAATGAMESVLGKLSALLADEHEICKGAPRGDVESLKADIEAIHSFLKNLSDLEDPNVQAKIWMKEVREFSYDIEDGLDESMLRAAPADDESADEPHAFAQKISKWLKEAMSHRCVGEEISGSISEAGDVAVDPRECFLYKEMSELVGIDGPADELIKMLKGGGEDASVQQLKVVSIVGCAGLGKTTLARRVHDTFGKQFNYRAFISVSRKPDVVMILRTILSQVGYEKTVLGDVELLIDNISNFLEDKRYFIILDDVWDVQTWDAIKRAFSKSSCGSRIIMTTRIHEVAKSCSAPYGGHVYRLGPLSVVDSERLFFTRISGSEEQCPSDLKKVPETILQKCGGLPLAIITISGLLATNTTEDQWHILQNSIGHGLGSNSAVEGMMRILSFSYFDLTPHLKSCLLYLSIFPKGYAIEKEHLVMRWIAEGLIPEEHGHTLFESGERCFNELINRSLIQPVRICKFGEVETCRVQDIFLDFIISKSKEENFVTLLGVPGVNPEPENKVRRLSLQNCCETDLILSNARSLSVFGCDVKISTLLEFRHLCVLDFEESGQLENLLADIGGLLHLKYLRLNGRAIAKLPQQIGELQYLETIDICSTNSSTEIPSTISRLQQLVRLVVHHDIILPDETGDIQALQVLELINVNLQSTNFIRKLGQLTNLRKLSVSFINYCAGDNWKENQEEMVSSICRLGKANLRVLHITINEGADEIFEESWCPAPCSLWELVIKVDVVSRVPRWIGSLVNLQKLLISMWEVGQEDVLILGGLPDLRYLCLTALAAGSKEGRLIISQNHGFSSLTHLQIGGEECALGLIFEAGSMPKLQKLQLEFDAEETDSLTNGSFDFGIEHLSCLTSISIQCTYDEPICPTLHAAMERVIRAHPNHPMLIWI